MNPIIWKPSGERVKETAMYRFMHEQGCENYFQLHDWSIDSRAEFWKSIVDFCDIKFHENASEILIESGDMTAEKWFVGGKLNFAEHLLRHRSQQPAIIFRGENGKRTEISYRDLYIEVAKTAAGMRSIGITKGDRVAGLLPNCPETIISMLATTSIGAIWSSCSPDFGVQGVVERFGQIKPKLLLCADGYYYNGKYFDSLGIISGILEQIKSIDNVIVIPFTEKEFILPTEKQSFLWSEFQRDEKKIHFETLPFNHPLYILYSSGTTGAPKCIVHGAGGTLIQHLKEHVLHCDINSHDRLFYFTTCGWMMWNWLVSGLASGATLILFDGFPFYQDGKILWKLAEEERFTIFGTSAKYLSAQEKAGIKPGSEFNLSPLETIFSTGSPLSPSSFDYVYREITNDVQLSSVSGGTDILGCFAAGNPLLPVRRGELQCLALGMDVSIFNDSGVSVINENGELVCTKSFPSMPIYFWDDPGNEKYFSAYFKKFKGVWAQGDYATMTDNKGMVIHGRSDAVLNPGGVRIGTSDIYRQVEKLDEVIESIAIGQNWNDDIRIVLFVIIKETIQLDETLKEKISKIIRENTTPRHVPEKIIQVLDIPRTISGKIVELAVRSTVHGEEVKNADALANPEALKFFADIPELKTD